MDWDDEEQESRVRWIAEQFAVIRRDHGGGESPSVMRARLFVLESAAALKAIAQRRNSHRKRVETLTALWRGVKK